MIKKDEKDLIVCPLIVEKISEEGSNKDISFLSPVEESKIVLFKTIK